jgi:hypothetical protein
MLKPKTLIHYNNPDGTSTKFQFEVLVQKTLLSYWKRKLRTSRQISHLEKLNQIRRSSFYVSKAGGKPLW